MRDFLLIAQQVTIAARSSVEWSVPKQAGDNLAETHPALPSCKGRVCRIKELTKRSASRIELGATVGSYYGNQNFLSGVCLREEAWRPWCWPASQRGQRKT